MAEFSPTRTHSTWKPRVTAAHLPYYRCAKCGNVVAGIDGAYEMEMRNDGERSLIFEPPYAHVDFHISCCGQEMEKLEPIPAADVADKFKMDYQIVGGLNNNCVNITWNSKDPAAKPRWFALKTFTGSMMKYVQPKKWPPMVFAFSDEDAFAYCNKNPCEECTFRCKSGMEIYAYVDTIGLVNLSMDRMAVDNKGAATVH